MHVLVAISSKFVSLAIDVKRIAMGSALTP